MAAQQVAEGARSSDGMPQGRVPVNNLLDLLRLRANNDPQRRAFAFLHENGGETSFTNQQLDLRARAIAAHLQQITSPGERVLLLYPPGLDFISGFFGCIYAGVLPVPTMYPKPRRPMPRLEAIAKDCAASAVLTTGQCLTTLDLGGKNSVLGSSQWVTSDAIADDVARQWRQHQPRPEDLAFLQYTSGSTSNPKGVMVSHANLMHNLEMIYEGFGFREFDFDQDAAVSWLPAYHDMGLIGCILQPIYTRAESILMSPTAFLRRPLRWLQAISDRRGAISGAPNFAYELCAEKITPEQRDALDLSCWKIAFCGAEPIHPSTLERFAETFAPAGFRESAFYPCYGLAEATLLVSGGDGAGQPVVKRLSRSALSEHLVVSANGEDDGQVQQLVSCGESRLGQQIVIANPETRQRCEPRRVGEIWIKGPSVTRGYWNRPEENDQTFNACLAESRDGGYLRTGDLGFLSDGQLFITGRLKDVIVIRGSNHYPQDIERTAEESHPGLDQAGGAAFSIEAGGQERLVIIHEVDRKHCNENPDEIIRSIRSAVSTVHELEVYAVALIRRGSLPRTTSGKVRRALCRDQFLAGQLKTHVQWRMETNGKSHGSNGQDSNGRHSGRESADDSTARSPERESKVKRPAPIQRSEKPLSTAEIDRLAERIESFMLEWLIERVSLPAEEIARDRPFAEFGIDSLTAVQLSQELEDWLHVHLTPVVAWNYPTPMALSRYLAEQVGGHRSESDELSEEQVATDTDMEKLLAEIESLSEAEAEAALQKLSGS